MAPFWWRQLGLLGLVAFFSALFGVIFGAATGFAVAALILLLVLARHLHNFQQLETWLKAPQEQSVPHGTGVWETVFSDLYHLMRLQSRSKHKLSLTLERFQEAAKAIPDGVVVLDTEDRIDWCNAAAEKQLGLDVKRDTGQQISYLLRESNFADYLRARQYDKPLILRSLRNRDAVLSVQFVPYGDRQKLMISHDVTELERTEKIRRDFVANVSHEMRTPLTVVGGFLETIQDLDHVEIEQLRQHVQLMLDQTRRMQRLVDDLLTLSRLEASQGFASDDVVDVPRLAHTLHDEATTLSAGRHVVTVKVDEDLFAKGSEHELRSAFSNLLSNAIRYTPEGGAITIRWEGREAGASFSVEDTGEGIEPQHIPRLTERFYRVDRGRSRETGGTGLGLAIVKHVLSRHQGFLQVTSTPGKGSTFRACLPAERIIRASSTEAAKPSA